MSLTTLGVAQDFEHVDPPHWYVGMAEQELQILVHEKDIALNDFILSKSEEGVSLKETVKFSNANYILLKVNISQNVQPHGFVIKSKGKAGKYSHTYELKSRHTRERGLSQEDIIYLITPDRFANGNPENDSSAEMNQIGIDRSEPYQRHGGDIEGIIKNLDYIQNLGMTAVWPNPLLENDQPHESYHGYAFTDYYKIDERFGSNKLYKALSDSLHLRGMKLIQDVVYNHIGNEHYLFKDLPDSSWFHFWDGFQKTNYRAPALMDPYASDYDKNIMTDGWFDKHMPDLDQTNPIVARYLIQQTLWWIEAFDIDALRIDTYAYPDQDFMREWGKEVKKNYPDIFLFAETWVHGTPVQAWFLGNGLGPEENYLDGLTDFQVYYAINDALTQDQSWTGGIAKLYYTLTSDYVYDEPENMVTFLDNHDLARFLGYVNSDLRKFEIGLGLLFTLRGIPSMYYGTELLMKETDGHGKIREDVLGGWAADSLNKFTPEGRSIEENKIYNYISDLSAFRKSSTALTQGKTIQFLPENGCYVFFRIHEDEMVMVAINTSEKEQEYSREKFSEVLNSKGKFVGIDGAEKTIEDSIELDPMSIQIYSVK